MKKKSLKKLILNKESISNLDRTGQRQVRGGAAASFNACSQPCVLSQDTNCTDCPTYTQVRSVCIACATGESDCLC